MPLDGRLPSALAAAIGLGAVILGLDGLSPHWQVVGLFATLPLLAALTGSPMETLLAGVAAVAFGLIDGAVFDHLGSEPYWTSMVSIAVVGVLATLLASLRASSAAAERELRDSEERLRMTLARTDTAVWQLDGRTGRLRGSENLASLYGLSERHPTAEQLKSCIHPEDVDRVDATSAHARWAEEDFELQFRVIRPDGFVHWLETRAHVAGRRSHQQIFGVVSDVTERKRQEQALEYLAEANTILDSSLDLDTTLTDLARITVPFLGDGCLVDVLEDEGIRRVGFSSKEPAVLPVLEKLRAQRLSPTGRHVISTALRTGGLQVIDHLTDEMKRDWALNEEHLEALRQWPARSLVVAPMRIGERVVGTITLASNTRESAFGDFEIWLIGELARRAAVAVDNAMAYTERAEIAETLQQSLLPASLPEIPGFDVAAHYRAGGSGVDVGGDFYDAFEVEHGWCILIGDVAGKGAAAAAVTSLARYTARAVAMRERLPSKILQAVNAALYDQLSGSQFCTMGCGLLRLEAGHVILELALGGHPLPLVRRVDGSVEQVGEPGGLLGVMPEPPCEDVRVRLEPGDALILYTDGVTEARTRDGRVEEGGLRTIVGSWEGSSAKGLVEHIEAAVEARRQGGKQDDVAILVTRVVARESSHAGGADVAAVPAA